MSSTLQSESISVVTDCYISQAFHKEKLFKPSVVNVEGQHEGTSIVEHQEVYVVSNIVFVFEFEMELNPM